MVHPTGRCSDLRSKSWKHALFPVLIVSSLALCGLQSAARAAGTLAGTSISNTATATYNDPSTPGLPLNAQSNTVTIMVAEVAGITNTPAGITDTTGGASVLPGHILRFDYLVTNVGNDPTFIFIPGAPVLTGPGTLVAATGYQLSVDGGVTYNSIPAAGLTTAAVAPNGQVRVRVMVTVNAAAPSGSSIAVLLGNTAPNDNSAGTQNQPLDAPNTPDDVRTVTGAPGEINGPPANGQREASALQSILVGATPQAFAAVYKTHGTLTIGADAQHDTMAYSLSMSVNATAPPGASPNIVPADLAPTSITLDGAPTNRVLISDAIPAATALNAAATPAAGWTAIYTVTPTTTTANSATWTTAAPSPLSNVTRVGFVNAAPVTRGTTVNGFGITVITSGASLTGSTTIANIGQLFGLSVGDTTNSLVYDESGDQNPSNFNDDGSRGSNVPTNGVANPATDGVDTNNNNTGTGAGGEDNLFTVAPAGAILNGPNGQPAAVGPTDNNDDFTNESSPIPAGTAPGSKITPAAVTFTNTINNPSAAAETNVLLVPQSPSVLPGGAITDIPTGTTVTLTLGANTAVYTYNGTIFVFSSGTAIQIPSLPAGASLSYTSVVKLPANTALSTDTGKGYPAPIRVFVDSNGNGAFDAGEPSNITVDRVYTGYLQLVKKARIVDTDGTTVIQDYTTTPTSANLRPGRFIDYQITYTNISSTPAGVGDVILNASSTIITEDGTTAPNNWALDNDGNSVIDTSNVIGTAVDSGPSTVGFFNGNPATTAGVDQTGTTAATDVSKYIVTVTGAIPPAAVRTFTFRRKIN